MTLKNRFWIIFLVCCFKFGAAGGVVSQDNYMDLKKAYAGAYIGGGVSFLSDQIYVRGMDNASAGFLQYASEELRNIPMGEVVDVLQSFSDANKELINTDRRKIGGSFNIGFGRFFYTNLYLGVDLTLDVFGENKSVATDKEEREYLGTFKTTTVQNAKLIPTFVMKAGEYISGIDFLICSRIGAALVSMKSQNTWFEEEVGVSKIVPVVGFSLEKAVGKNDSIKLECDYRFAAKKKVEKTMQILGKKMFIACSESIRTRGYSIRLMYVYHF